MRLFLPRNGFVYSDSGRHLRPRIFGDLRVRAKIQPIWKITKFGARLEWLDLSIPQISKHSRNIIMGQ